MTQGYRAARTDRMEQSLPDRVALSDFGPAGPKPPLPEGEGRAVVKPFPVQGGDLRATRPEEDGFQTAKNRPRPFLSGGGSLLGIGLLRRQIFQEIFDRTIQSKTKFRKDV